MDAVITQGARNSSNKSAHVAHDNTSRCHEHRTGSPCTTITADTSLCFVVGIRIPQRRVVLEVGFSRPCGQAFNIYLYLLQAIMYVEITTRVFERLAGYSPSRLRGGQ